MDGTRMEVEVGAPTKGVLEGDGRVSAGTLPGGRYVEATYRGHYDGLRGAHEALHQRLGEQGMTPQGISEGGRSTLLEIYETDPDEVPNPDDWITHIVFKLPD
jgi:effector-binding domain-containing protein